MQLSELREYAARRGWIISSEYVDQGVSGSKESRPQLNRLMADAHRRKFDAVLVWKIDRYGRSLKHLVNALADLCAYGVAFVSFRDNLDLSTPSGRLMFQIIGAMAEFERSLIQERVRPACASSRQGKEIRKATSQIDAAGWLDCAVMAFRGPRYARLSMSARVPPIHIFLLSLIFNLRSPFEILTWIVLRGLNLRSIHPGCT